MFVVYINIDVALFQETHKAGKGQLKKKSGGYTFFLKRESKKASKDTCS